MVARLPSVIRHVVAWELTGVTPQERRANAETVREALETLPALVPVIRDLHVGIDVGDTPGNGDVVLVMDVDSREDLEAYQVHPEHQKVAAIIVSLRAGQITVDHEV